MDSSGNRIAELRYKPWGSVRYEWGITPTDFTFTGQKSKVDGFGLLYFNARWFDPALGRFSQADTVIPGAGNPMAWDRFAYVMNNPLRYIDPTGNRVCEGEYEDDCGDPGDDNWVYIPPPPPPPEDPDRKEMEDYIASFGITLKGDWSWALLNNLWEALFTHIGYKKLPFWLNGKMVTLIWGGVGDCNGTYNGWTQGDTVTFHAEGITNPVINILHEFGHLVDNLWDDFFTNQLEHVAFTLKDSFLSGWNGEEYISLPTESKYDIRNLGLFSSIIGAGDAWQQRGGTPHWEDWADIFANAMIGNIDQSKDLGRQIYSFANNMIKHVMDTE